MSFEFLARLEEVTHSVRQGEVIPSGATCDLVNRSSDTGTHERF